MIHHLPPPRRYPSRLARQLVRRHVWYRGHSPRWREMMGVSGYAGHPDPNDPRWYSPWKGASRDR